MSRFLGRGIHIRKVGRNIGMGVKRIYRIEVGDGRRSLGAQVCSAASAANTNVNFSLKISHLA